MKISHYQVNHYHHKLKLSHCQESTRHHQLNLNWHRKILLQVKKMVCILLLNISTYYHCTKCHYCISPWSSDKYIAIPVTNNEYPSFYRHLMVSRIIGSQLGIISGICNHQTIGIIILYEIVFMKF